MKKQYVIVMRTPNSILYYNADFNLFSAKHPTIFTNKKIAMQKMLYADKYASGNVIPRKLEVVLLHHKIQEDI